MIGDKKIKHGRLRPKPSSKNKKKITDEDKQFLRWAKNQDFACFVCGEYGSIELHHVKEYSCDKKNHKEILPLCGEKCHRLGMELSAHGTPVKFRNSFPIKLQIIFAKGIYDSYLKEFKDS